MSADKKVSASDIRAALMVRYPAPTHALLWEVGNGTGANIRRWADAVAMCLYPSRGLEIEGIEIKVSRSDWQRELANPEKSAPVQKYCDRWWIAAPHKLISADELPATWGLMELLSNGTLRAAKPAPQLSPEPVNRQFMAAVLRRASEADADVVTKLVQERVDRLTQSIREDQEAKTKRATERANQVLETVREVKEATGIDLLYGYTDAAQLIAAINLTGPLFSKYGQGSLDMVARNAAVLAESINKLLKTTKQSSEGAG